MIKLFRYLKGAIFPIILVIALLFVQAICDLTLPDYTSRIVNVGIQQGGIDKVLPQVLVRDTLYDPMMMLLHPDQQDLVSDAYQLVIPSQLSEGDLQALEKKYPSLSGREYYALKPGTVETPELEDALSRGIMMLSMLTTDQDNMKAFKEQLIAMLPPGTVDESASMLMILALLPQQARDSFITQLDEQVSIMPESIVKQSAIGVIKHYYEKDLGISTEALQSSYIWLSGLQMLGLALLSMAATIAVGFISARVAASLGRELRSNVFQKVLSFSNEEFDRFSTASLITRSTNDIQQIQMLTMMLLRIVFYAPIMAIGGVIKVLDSNSTMSWIIAVAVMATLSVILVMFSMVMPKFKIVQKLIDRVNLVMREILTGLPVIRAFSTQLYEEQRFDQANTSLTKTNLFIARMMSAAMPLMMLIMNGVSIVILWNGAIHVDNGHMQVGDIIAFIQYTMQIIMAFLMISMLSMTLPRAAVSAGRINEVLLTEARISNPSDPKAFLPNQKGVVEFVNVSFRYPEAKEDVLSHISFTALPGQTTAIIGGTGSGKSTLVHLIPRFFDVTQGKVMVDGMDIKEVSMQDLRRRIGYVPQTGILFSGTIQSNIAFGCEDASDEQIQTAAAVAQAKEFIDEKPDGYTSEIAQGGTNVSGGQKQRLSIARAVAIDPEIFIFDDSFSALDYKTDAELRKALKEHTANSTVLIVAQRISTILHADQIIVLDEGRIVGKGSHQQLMQECEVYQQIALSQLSKEELA